MSFYPFPNQALDCTCLQYRSFENTVEKGEIARKPLSSNLKLSSANTFSLESQKFVVWERVKRLFGCLTLKRVRSFMVNFHIKTMSCTMLIDLVYLIFYFSQGRFILGTTRMGTVLL